MSNTNDSSESNSYGLAVRGVLTIKVLLILYMIFSYFLFRFSKDWIYLHF
jgi:hypothetical protein